MQPFVNTSLFLANGNLNLAALRSDNTPNFSSSNFGITPEKGYAICQRNIISNLATPPPKKFIAYKPSITLTNVEKDFIKRYLRIHEVVEGIKSRIKVFSLKKFLSQNKDDPQSDLAKFLSNEDVVAHLNSQFWKDRDNDQDLNSKISFIIDFSKYVNSKFTSILDSDNRLVRLRFDQLSESYSIHSLSQDKTQDSYFIEEIDNNGLALSHYDSQSKLIQEIKAYNLFSASEDYPGFLLDLGSENIPMQALSEFINNLFDRIPESKKNKVVFYFRANSDKLSTDLLKALIDFPSLSNCFLELWTNTYDSKKSILNILKTNFSFEEFYYISKQEHSLKLPINDFSFSSNFKPFVVSMLDLDKLFSLKTEDNAEFKKNLIKEIFLMSYDLYYYNLPSVNNFKSFVNEFISKNNLNFDDSDQLYNIKLLYLMLKYKVGGDQYENKVNEYNFMIYSLVIDDHSNSSVNYNKIKEKLVNKIFDIHLNGSMTIDDLYEIQSLQEELHLTNS